MWFRELMRLPGMRLPPAPSSALDSMVDLATACSPVTVWKNCSVAEVRERYAPHA